MTRAQAEHDSECPDIGPICQVRDEPPQHHETTLWVSDLRLLGEYGLFRGLALQAVVPFRFVDSTTRFTDLAGAELTLDYPSIHHRNETLFGFGDPQMLAHAGTSLGRVRLGGRVGVSIPLGATEPDPYELGEMGLEHEHIQFGTGTFDPLLGGDASLDLKSWVLAGFVSAQLPLYEGSLGYQAGSRIFGGLAASTKSSGKEPTYRITLIGFHETTEKWHGVPPEEEGNLGRSDLFLGPGVTIPLGGDYTVSMDVRVRAYADAVNAQLELPVLVDLSFGTLLHLESGGEATHGVSTGHDDSTGGDVEDIVHNGELVPLSPVPGKWTIFDFWATWCEACGRLDSELRELARHDDRVAIRRVNIVDFDSPIAVSELEDVSLLPRIRVVDPSGATVFEQSGRVQDLMSKLREHLRQGS